METNRNMTNCEDHFDSNKPRNSLKDILLMQINSIFDFEIYKILMATLKESYNSTENISTNRALKEYHISFLKNFWMLYKSLFSFIIIAAWTTVTFLPVENIDSNNFLFVYLPGLFVVILFIDYLTKQNSDRLSWV